MIGPITTEVIWAIAWPALNCEANCSYSRRRDHRNFCVIKDSAKFSNNPRTVNEIRYLAVCLVESDAGGPAIARFICDPTRMNQSAQKHSVGRYRAVVAKGHSVSSSRIGHESPNHFAQPIGLIEGDDAIVDWLTIISSPHEDEVVMVGILRERKFPFSDVADQSDATTGKRREHWLWKGHC
jgi:hypothetical protein